MLADKEKTGIQTCFPDWQWALGSKSLKININKTETMVCAKKKETLMIRDRTGHLLKHRGRPSSQLRQWCIPSVSDFSGKIGFHPPKFVMTFLLYYFYSRLLSICHFPYFHKMCTFHPISGKIHFPFSFGDFSLFSFDLCFSPNLRVTLFPLFWEWCTSVSYNTRAEPPVKTNRKIQILRISNERCGDKVAVNRMTRSRQLGKRGKT